MYLKEDSASKRGKYEHAPGAYPAYPPAAAPGAAPYYPPAAPGAAPAAAAAAAANRQYVSGEGVSLSCNIHHAHMQAFIHVFVKGSPCFRMQ